MGSHSCPAMKNLLVLVVLLLCVCGESKPSKPARSARVWHEAETEEDCGNFTSLRSDEKPSELCTEQVEINTTVCLCTTRDTTIKETETIVNTEVEWTFKCGTCQMKLFFDEKENEENKTGRRKKKGQQNKKMTKAEKKRMQERTKMRKKMKGKQQNKREKTRNKRNDKKTQSAQPRTDQ